jgi:hypothetical protein
LQDLIARRVAADANQDAAGGVISDAVQRDAINKNAERDA